MNELLDEIGERESHPLMGLLDIVTLFVGDYEDKPVKMRTEAIHALPRPALGSGLRAEKSVQTALGIAHN